MVISSASSIPSVILLSSESICPFSMGKVSMNSSMYSFGYRVYQILTVASRSSIPSDVASSASKPTLPSNPT